MDFKLKSMKWVESLQEKIATTYTELDERLVEDARLVGAHVNAVGTHVNRFFVDIMEDFIPISCISNEEKLPVPPESCVVSPMGENSCQSSNSSEVCNDHDISGLLPPPSLEPVRYASLGEIIAPCMSEQTTEEDVSAKNEKPAPCLLEMDAPAVDQGSCLDSPQNTNTLATEVSSAPAKGDTDTLLYSQFSADQEVDKKNLVPLPREGLAIHSALRDMSMSSFFREVLDFGCQKAHIVSPVEGTAQKSSAQSELVSDNAINVSESKSDMSGPLSLASLSDVVELNPGDANDTFHEIVVDATESDIALPTEVAAVQESSPESELVHKTVADTTESDIAPPVEVVATQESSPESELVHKTVADTTESDIAPPMEVVAAQESSPESESVHKAVADTTESDIAPPMEVVAVQESSPESELVHETVADTTEFDITPPNGVTGQESSPESELTHETDIDVFDYWSDASRPIALCDSYSPAVPYLDFDSKLSFDSIKRTEVEVLASVNLPSSVVDDSSMENVDLHSNIKLGESCLLVDPKETLVPPKTKTNRSFKKKLQNVLPFRMRFKKRQIHPQEQLQVPNCNANADITQRGDNALSSIPFKYSRLNVSEENLSDSEWELV